MSGSFITDILLGLAGAALISVYIYVGALLLEAILEKNPVDPHPVKITLRTLFVLGWPVVFTSALVYLALKRAYNQIV